METSTIYSMGTALDRAHDGGCTVEVLVGGTWLVGLVVANDGHGVILETDPGTHTVTRLDSVMAVRVHAELPGTIRIPGQFLGA